MDKDAKEREQMAAFIHGALSFGHLVGVVHNIKHKNWLQALLHAAVCSYDAWATFRHKDDAK